MSSDDDWDVPPSGAAQAILENETFQQVLNEQEQMHFEECFNASPENDEQRRGAMHKVRALRTLREHLETLAAGTKNT